MNAKFVLQYHTMTTEYQQRCTQLSTKMEQLSNQIQQTEWNISNTLKAQEPSKWQLKLENSLQHQNEATKLISSLHINEQIDSCPTCTQPSSNVSYQHHNSIVNNIETHLQYPTNVLTQLFTEEQTKQNNISQAKQQHSTYVTQLMELEQQYTEIESQLNKSSQQYTAQLATISHEHGMTSEQWKLLSEQQSISDCQQILKQYESLSSTLLKLSSSPSISTELDTLQTQCIQLPELIKSRQREQQVFEELLKDEVTYTTLIICLFSNISVCFVYFYFC
jgi:hypothetical protein